jgi:hypothetical protein
LIVEHLAGRVPGWSLAGRNLLAWQPGGGVEPDQFATLVAPFARVAELLAVDSGPRDRPQLVAAGGRPGQVMNGPVADRFPDPGGGPSLLKSEK